MNIRFYKATFSGNREWTCYSNGFAASTIWMFGDNDAHTYLIRLLKANGVMR